MDDFFAIYDTAKEVFGLTFLVHYDLDEAYIKIHQGEKLIVKAEGSHIEQEALYQQALIRLIAWIKLIKLRESR